MSFPFAVLAVSQKIAMARLRVNGTWAYAEAEWPVVSGFKPESKLAIADRCDLDVGIGEHCHQNGYLVIHAYLSAQNLKDGVLMIAVIDGQSRKFMLRHQSNLSDRCPSTVGAVAVDRLHRHRFGHDQPQPLDRRAEPPDPQRRRRGAQLEQRQQLRREGLLRPQAGQRNGAFGAGQVGPVLDPGREVFLAGDAIREPSPYPSKNME